MLVSDRMTSPAYTVHPDIEYRKALQIMQACQVGHLPVVDDGGRLIGLVSEDDLLFGAGRLLDTCAEVVDVAVSPAIHAAPTATVVDVAALMLAREIAAVPIVERERVVGIFTTRDLLCACIDLLGNHDVPEGPGAVGERAGDHGDRTAERADGTRAGYRATGGTRPHPQAAMAG